MTFSKTSASLFPVVAVLLLLVPRLGAQTAEETILRSYERIFIRSSLNIKVNVLLDAANDEAADKFYGAFCELALRFVMDNAPLFPNDPDMINITAGAIKGVGKYVYGPAAETLWQVFLRFPDTMIRSEILKILPVLDAPILPGKINQFLVEQNSLYGSGPAPDLQLLSTLFAVLGKIGDESSYPVLFASSLIYSGDTGTEAAKAISEIKGDFYRFCRGVVLNNPPPEKLKALKLAAARADFTGEQKGALAEAALEAALASSSPERRNQNQDLCELAVRLIEETEQISALPVVIKYYNQCLTLFKFDTSQKQPLLDTISCLAALKSSDIARILSFQLGIYNSRAGVLSPEEHEIALALISGLGRLGYRISYDSVYQASVLPYPEKIRNAALDVLNRLR